jgi:hypothetical protein
MGERRILMQAKLALVRMLVGEAEDEEGGAEGEESGEEEESEGMEGDDDEDDEYEEEEAGAEEGEEEEEEGDLEVQVLPPPSSSTVEGGTRGLHSVLPSSEGVRPGGGNNQGRRRSCSALLRAGDPVRKRLRF